MFSSTDGHCPQVGGSLTEANLGAAEDDHEEEWGQEMHREVDDDHQGEHVHRVTALLPLHPRHPDTSRHQPADLKQDVDWKQERWYWKYKQKAFDKSLNNQIC